MSHADPAADPLWQRVLATTPTAVLGRLPDPPPELRLIRVSCEVAPAALRPLLEARRLTEAIVGEARPRPAGKPRGRTLFGDPQERATDAVLVDLWHQLSRQPGARWVVVVDAVERADEATLAALTRLARRTLPLPLALVFHNEPDGAAADLLAAVRERDAEAVLRGAQPSAGEQPLELTRLPPKLLRVLRAGALIGPGFELRLVADLLGDEPLHVLERLQQAIDRGVPVEDRGEGRFSLPTAALTALSASLMPSLAQAWHRKLGRLLGARAAAEAAPPQDEAAAFHPESVADARVAALIDMSDDVVEETARPITSEHVPATSPPPPAPKDTPPAEPAISNVAELVARGPAGAQEDLAAAASEARYVRKDSPAPSPPASDPAPQRPVQRRTVLAPPGEGKRAERPRTLVLAPDVDMPAPLAVQSSIKPFALPGDPLVDAVRAAEHMRLAGDLDAAAEHLCVAARKAAEVGAPQAAVEHASAALGLLAALPVTVPRQRLRARALLELGRVQWQAPGFEHGFTLAQARATLEAARAELDADAPTELAVDLAQAIAGVHFDIGDPSSLARALAEVETAGARLHAANDTLAAAALYNDQAAIHIRMGDATRALKLIRASRAVFEARAHRDPAALRELAESEHLFAILPFHARMRLGREDEGYAAAMEHALAAERMFGELEDTRELARVWETIGRIELRRLHIEEARVRLVAAFEAQTRLGDLTGLAQTTEFLSEVLAWCGRNVDAIAALRESVVYNRDKGSPRGLMSNRQAFANLASRFAKLTQHADALREVEVLLAAGERELGVQPA